MNRLLKVLVVRLMMLLGLGLAYAQPPFLFEDAFARPDGPIASVQSQASPDWEVQSGSLLAAGGAAWTGLPDNLPGRGTQSSVFRVLTRRDDFGDAVFALTLSNRGLGSTSTTPPRPWDGIHLMLRYQADGRYYHVSVNRRDGAVVVKKRVPGAYHNLTPLVRHPFSYRLPQQVRAVARNEEGGAVLIELYEGEVLLASARDTGASGGPPLLQAGRFGVGGDNCDFTFDDVRVSALSPADVQPPVFGAIEVSNVTEGLASVFWTTDEAADSQVEYSADMSYGGSTPLARPLVLSHTSALSGLKKATSYHFRVRSKDAAGNLAVSPDQTFMTASGADAQKPDVALASPAPGAAVEGLVEVFASAADDVAVTGVQLRLDGVNLGPERLAPPYSASWDSSRALNGNHILTAVARDAAGNLTVSAPVTVTVLNRAGGRL